jgi:hypothetical protein
MFVLAVIEDKVKILPENFDKDHTQVSFCVNSVSRWNSWWSLVIVGLLQSLIDQIDLKYVNKVT